MNYVLILCKDYDLHIHKFCKLLNEKNDFKTIMIIDKNSEDFSKKFPSEVYQISDKICIENGFKNCCSGLANSLIHKNPISWDKALFFLSKNDFNKAIIYEDDCLVLNPKIFSSWFKMSFDLITSAHNLRTGTYKDWHWGSIEKSIGSPYYYSMVCCIGVSKKLIDKIIKHKNKIGSFFFIESMFNTIAEQNKLEIKTPKELSSIVATGEWESYHFRLFKNNIFHPVKNTEKHNFFRFLNLVYSKYCFEINHKTICPLPFQKLLIPKFLKR